MDAVDIDMSELNRFERTLAAAGVEVQKVSEKVLTEAAAELKQAAIAAAPERTGALKRSIRITAGKEYRRVGSKLKQGFFQEFGTSRHGPQPWLFHNGDRAGVAIEQQLTRDGVRALLKR